jgi:2-polyprenyl-3-methyl-5-hydroxy-6-metoxy-1,4-benzoquinol methylase
MISAGKADINSREIGRIGMAAIDRLAREQAFHDRQAQQRAADFALRPDALDFDDDTYLDHETWIRPAIERLGELTGLRVLDYGCGHGMAAVVLARRGAQVTAFDLSHGYLDEARRRARANGVAVDFVQADGQRLPFHDDSFDRIWGNAILHHVDLEVAAGELRRVLRPSGVAVFCEPWGGNPLLNWARNTLPYPGKERTAGEQPLQRRHVQILRRTFASVEIRGYQLLSMARRLTARRRLVAGLDWCDTMLLTRVPALQMYCRYVVLTLRR